MTTLQNRPNSALLVVDVQSAVVDGAYRRDDVVANIAALVDRARRERVPVVWVRHHDETANATLLARTNSWYVGSNVPGKPRRVLSYTGGVGTYRQKCLELAEGGYQGFDRY